MAYNSTNPVFQPKFWNTIQGNDRMTLEGTLQKTGILFGIATASAVGSDRTRLHHARTSLPNDVDWDVCYNGDGILPLVLTTC